MDTVWISTGEMVHGGIVEIEVRLNNHLYNVVSNKGGLQMLLASKVNFTAAQSIALEIIERDSSMKGHIFIEEI